MGGTCLGPCLILRQTCPVLSTWGGLHLSQLGTAGFRGFWPFLRYTQRTREPFHLQNPLPTPACLSLYSQLWKGEKLQSGHPVLCAQHTLLCVTHMQSLFSNLEETKSPLPQEASCSEATWLQRQGVNSLLPGICSQAAHPMHLVTRRTPQSQLMTSLVPRSRSTSHWQPQPH